MEKVISGPEPGGRGEGGTHSVELRSRSREHFIHFINKRTQFTNLTWGLADLVWRPLASKVRKRDDSAVCSSDHVDHVLLAY